MTRRQLFKALFALPLAPLIPQAHVTGILRRGLLQMPINMPSGADWVGASCGSEVMEDILKMVQKLQEDKKYGPYTLLYVEKAEEPKNE